MCVCRFVFTLLPYRVILSGHGCVLSLLPYRVPLSNRVFHCVFRLRPIGSPLSGRVLYSVFTLLPYRVSLSGRVFFSCFSFCLLEMENFLTIVPGWWESSLVWTLSWDAGSCVSANCAKVCLNISVTGVYGPKLGHWLVSECKLCILCRAVFFRVFQRRRGTSKILHCMLEPI